MRLSTPAFLLSASLAVGACGGSAGSAGGPAVIGQAVPLLYALLVDTVDTQSPANSEIEIVDLSTHTRVGGFLLPGVRGESLAVSPDGSRLYIADGKGGQILMRSPEGLVLGSVPFVGVTDIVLDATGTRLWANSFVGPKIARFDALTLAPAVSITPPGMGVGIAISPDGTKLAWASCNCYGGGVTGCYIVNAQTLAGPVPVSFAGAACNQVPTDVRFVNDSRLVVWDAGCDRLHQVDANTNTFLVMADVAFQMDNATSYNGNNCLCGTASSARVYGTKESGQVLRIDPLVPSSSAPTPPSGSPVLVTLTPDEQSLLVFSYGFPVKVTRMSTSTESFAPNVYTFASTFAYARGAVTRLVTT